MSQIKNKNTKIEIELRKHIWKNGIKNYRVKNKIQGKPDLYFPKLRIAVFVDGCFWHKCPKCFRWPKTNKEFWQKKIKANIKRDKELNKKLKNQKISVIRFWEHDLRKNLDKCFARFKKHYENKS